MIRTAAIALGLSAALTASAPAQQTTVDIQLTPLSFPTTLLADQKVEFLSAAALSAQDPRFGGLSGLLIDGDRLRAIGDRGIWLEADAERNAQGAIIALRAARIGTLQDQDGDPLSGRRIDAEGLADDGAGGVWISFEQRHRITGRRSLEAAADRALGALPTTTLRRNGGFEGLARATDGALWVLAEEPGPRETRLQGWRLFGGVAQPFFITRLEGYDATGADFGPDGALYLLERRYNPLTGVRMRVRRFPAATLAAVDRSAAGRKGAAGAGAGAGAGPDLGAGETLLALDPRAPIDNMEGLSVASRDDGRLTLTAISDDNFNIVQRTVLLQFLAAPAD